MPASQPGQQSLPETHAINKTSFLKMLKNFKVFLAFPYLTFGLAANVVGHTSERVPTLPTSRCLHRRVLRQLPLRVPRESLLPTPGSTSRPATAMHAARHAGPLCLSALSEPQSPALAPKPWGTCPAPPPRVRPLPLSALLTAPQPCWPPRGVLPVRCPSSSPDNKRPQRDALPSFACRLNVILPCSTNFCGRGAVVVVESGAIRVVFLSPLLFRPLPPTSRDLSEPALPAPLPRPQRAQPQRLPFQLRP